MYINQFFCDIIYQICSLLYCQLRLSTGPSVRLYVSPSYDPASKIQSDILVRTLKLYRCQHVQKLEVINSNILLKAFLEAMLLQAL